MESRWSSRAISDKSASLFSVCNFSMELHVSNSWQTAITFFCVISHTLRNNTYAVLVLQLCILKREFSAKNLRTLVGSWKGEWDISVALVFQKEGLNGECFSLGCSANQTLPFYKSLRSCYKKPVPVRSRVDEKKEKLERGVKEIKMLERFVFLANANVNTEMHIKNFW